MNKKKSRFLLGMTVYAAVFLAVTAAGLGFLWNFMEAYEASRPNNAVKAYMDSLTEEHILAQSQRLLDSIDARLQAPEESREILLEALSGGIRQTKKSKECTDTRLVYMLQTGNQVVGSFTLEAGEPDRYGFTPWTLAEESFDLSHLLGETVTVTAPDVCTVSVNGVVLEEAYITGTQPYEALGDYYQGNQLPTQVVYQIGPLLGTPEVVITDPEGNPVTFDENTDWSLYYNNCTQQETEELQEFIAGFVRRYVEFTGSNKNTRKAAYNALLRYVRSDSELALRMKNALDGLQFGQSVNDEIVSIDIRPQVRLADGFLADVTYEVDTTGREGVVRTTTNMRLRIVYADGAMKVESIQVY